MTDEISTSFSTRLQDLRESIQAGNLDRATALLKNMPDKWHNRPQVLASAARVQFQGGDYAEALTSIKAARQAGASSAGILHLQARAQKNLGDVAGYAETLNLIIKRFPDNSFALRQLALHHLAQDRVDAAQACAAALPRTEQGHAFRLSLDYQLAIARADLPEVSMTLHRILAESPICPDLPGLVSAMLELPEGDRQELFERMTKKWPNKWPNLESKLKIRRFSSATEKPEHNLKQRAMALALSGQELKAQRLLSEFGASGKMESETIEMIECLPPQASLRRPVVVDNGDDVILSPIGETGTTLLVFTGLADQAMVPIEIVDRFCAAEGHSAIYLRDTSRSAYIAGVPALAEDFEGTLVVLAGLLDQFGTRRLRCLGTSLGGFAAIRYGIRLKAEQVMGASAPTNITSNFIAEIGDNRGRLVARRLQMNFGANELDLRPEVTTAKGLCKIDLWFGTGYPIDVKHASYLTGCAGVSHFPIAGLEGHSSFPHIVTSGGFQKFLAA